MLLQAESLEVKELIELLSGHNAGLRESAASLHTNLKTAYAIDARQLPEVKIIFRSFERLKQIAEEHLSKEEEFLFPIALQFAVKHTGKLPKPRLVRVPLAESHGEHLELQGQVLKIKILTGHYNPPVNSSPAFKRFCSEFICFEQELNDHIEAVEKYILPDLEIIGKRKVQSQLFS